MATTYNNLYLDLRTELRRAGDEEATQSARELVCAAAAKTREELVRDGSLYASPEVEKSARELVKRHLAGEPVAYLIGEWEFYGLPLDISPAVLIPRPDTEVLATKLIDAARGAGACRILDLCAGSGCIGLAAAANLPNARVLLGEYDEEALKICRQNIRRNRLTARVASLKIDARESPRARWASSSFWSATRRTSRARTSTRSTLPCASTSRALRLTAARTGSTSTV